MNNLYKRTPWLVLTVTALMLEAVALISQHAFDLQPCNECVYIRLGVAGLALAGLLGASAPSYLAVRLVASAAAVLALGWSLYRATLLVMLEHRVSLGESIGCQRFFGFPKWAPLDVWLPGVFQPNALCGEAAGNLLGLSFAQWTLVGLAATALCMIWFPVYHRLSRRG